MSHVTDGTNSLLKHSIKTEWTTFFFFNVPN